MPLFPNICAVLRRTRRRFYWRDVLDQATLASPRTEGCFQAIESDPSLDYNLPKRRDMLAGGIMRHCCETLDRLLEREAPCVYKIGFTGDATKRWYSQRYGYSKDPLKWTQLIVVYAASETISPAFVEAALIQRHKGNLDLTRDRDFFCIVYNSAKGLLLYIYIYIL